MKNKGILFFLMLVMLMSAAGCGAAPRTADGSAGAEGQGAPAPAEKNGHDYTLLQIADGYTMFRDAPLLQNKVKLDNQVLIDYIADSLGGEIGEEYADPYGQGRIVILEDPAAGASEGLQ